MRRHLVAVVAVAVVATACSQTTAERTVDGAAARTTSTRLATTTSAAPSTTTTTVAERATTTQPRRLLFDSGLTQMLSTGPEDWDSLFIDPGGVIYHDGLFHSFYNGIGDWPAHAQIGYATSPDGKEWEKQTTAGLFSGDGFDWTGVSIFVHDAIVLRDGTWALYFSTAKSSHDLFTGVIGMATAPAPAGPWTVTPTPVLEAGPEGSWDSDGVIGPTVVQVGEQLWMYYSGNTATQRMIGLATSDDGYTWTKFDNPETADISDALLRPGARDAWDEAGLYNPQVVIADDGFAMSYLVHSNETTGPIDEVGLAYSDDGKVWRKDPSGPYLSSEHWGLASILLSALVHHNDEYILYFDGQRRSGGTTVYFVTHQGPLLP